MKTFRKFAEERRPHAHSDALTESVQTNVTPLAVAAFRKIQELHHQVASDREATIAQRCLSAENLGIAAIGLVCIGLLGGDSRLIQIARSGQTA